MAKALLSGLKAGFLLVIIRIHYGKNLEDSIMSWWLILYVVVAENYTKAIIED